ncbi:MAG TPA: TauD/TfdA family dioxygenase [Mycobacteriales bacterium]|jgi:hypothetical protein|nr:TauD/TfdA family dioxygenase [Mycobacteriales bacterium]
MALEDVRTYGYGPGGGLPLFVEPERPGSWESIDQVVSWFSAHRPELDRLATDVGAVVLRGFPIHDTADFNALVDGYPAPTFGYSGGATPRVAIAGRAYEATRSPAGMQLKLHQEMAYLPNYPARLAFFCKTPPATGGETIIGDMRRVDAAIRPEFRARVKEHGVFYGRNFRDPDWSCGDETLDSFHVPWTLAFATTDRHKAEADCDAMGLAWEWVDGSLSTSYRSRGFVDHPDTGQEIWFNQIATQSSTVKNLGSEKVLHYPEYYGDRPRPWDTRYGDGTPIDPDDVDSLYTLLDDAIVAFPWQHGDVMFVDNYNTAHGRNPYTGTRDVQVALLGGEVS